jgi:putative ABC transport system substrate-binding protein
MRRELRLPGHVLTSRRRFPLVILAAALIVVAHGAGGQSTHDLTRMGILFPWPRAQPPVVGVEALLERLSDLGWTEGRNLTIERRWAQDSDQLSALAAELIAQNVAILVVPGPQATLAALRVTKSIPIVTVGFTDPVAAGVAVSLNRPGGNLTGVTVGDPQLWNGKRLEILTEVIPGLQRVAVLWDANVKRDHQQLDAVATKLGLRLHHLAIRSPAELENAFKTARSGHAGAVMVMETPLLTLNAPLVAQHGAKYRLPVISVFSRMVEDGALVSYGPDLTDLFRHAAVHVDKILRGASPAVIPIEQPSTFELVINLRTAQELRITFDDAFLQRADRIIK